jgi:hypothetical protein
MGCPCVRQKNASEKRSGGLRLVQAQPFQEAFAAVLA